jgi:hypothetical protein
VKNLLLAAMQGQVGTAVVREDISTSVTGLSATASVGSVTVQGNNTVNLLVLRLQAV